MGRQLSNSVARQRGDILRSRAVQYEVNFAASTELSIAASNTNYDFLAPKRVIEESLVINKQGSEKDKLFHLTEPFQLINSKDKIKREHKQS